MELSAYHNSNMSLYRSPRGAAPCGTEVTVALDLFCDRPQDADVLLRVWTGEEKLIPPENRQDMAAQKGQHIIFRITMPESPCLLWYNFRIITKTELLYLGAMDHALRSGESVLTHDMPNDYRITVYSADFETPEWFKRSITYQIFPDRFNRGHYPGTVDAIRYHEGMGRRVRVKAWGDEVDFLPLEGEKHYSPSDYYLGNLHGIVDKIPYLKSLGVSAVYLNPIFESPYNHRYSVSDYMSIDPLLGNENDFVQLIEALHSNGIRLILDGVFSHTGDDSVYFNRYGNYPSTGAYQSRDSEYYSWYDFSKWPDKYRSWWGFATLPEVNEIDPSYIAFIKKVLNKWTLLGVDGWRLDVADELPDEFIRMLRQELKRNNPDILLLGEVWEDASTKTCFGARRGYVNGDELDGVMNYPFADAVCDFLLNRIDAYALCASLYAQKEGYPAPFYRAQLGLLGSHDTVRILTRLSDAPHRDALSRKEQHRFEPSASSKRLGRRRIRMATALQFSMPFPPCIYYGDEAGMEGMADPFCRRAFPWGSESNELTEHYRMLGKSRLSSPSMLEGDAEFVAVDVDTVAILRYFPGNNTIRTSFAPATITVVSRSAAREVELMLDLKDTLTGNIIKKHLCIVLDENGVCFAHQVELGRSTILAVERKRI